MEFEVSAPKRLSGEVGLPGDRLLTLTVLAIAAVGGKPVEIRGVSSAPSVIVLQKFLQSAGVSIAERDNVIAVWGNGYHGALNVPSDVPDEVLHLILPAAVFSAERVVIEDPDDTRNRLVHSLLPLLHTLGVSGEAVRKSDAGWEITGSRLIPPEQIELASAWELEAVSIAALATGTSQKVSFSRTEAGSALSLLRCLGLGAESPEPPRENNTLARRLARLSGERNRETLTLDWDFRGRVLDIPGDTTLAGALAGAASLVPRSDILLRGVLWEPGRRGFFEALRRMRVTVDWTPRKSNGFDTADIRVRSASLEGIRITPVQARTMTAELTLLAVTASVARGESIIRFDGSGTGIDEQTRKTLALGLESLGAHIGDYPDGIVVKGGAELRGNLADAGSNPAVALAMTLAGLAAAGSTVVFGFDGEAYPVGLFRRILAGLCGNTKTIRDSG